MRFGSLFTGIGGLDLGLERAGMTCAWQVEIDDYCNRVLAKHWPSVPRLKDVREAGKHNLPPVDLIAGGFPCQPVSLAGRRLGQADERWLWPEFARIIRELRPRYALLENVPGLLVSGMDSVLGDLAACGYDAEWDCIPAEAVGAPHKRHRVFIVAYPGGERLEGLYTQRGRIYLQSAADTLRREWETEPAVDRVANGVPSGMDRLRALGNAVVPQAAEWIGRRIVECDSQ